MYNAGDRVICVQLPEGDTSFKIGKVYIVWIRAGGRLAVTATNIESHFGYKIDNISSSGHCFKLVEEPTNLPSWW